MSVSSRLASCSFISLSFSLILLGLLLVVVKFLAENSLMIIGFLGSAFIIIFMGSYLKTLFARWERDRAWKKLEQEIEQELEDEFNKEKKKSRS